MNLNIQRHLTATFIHKSPDAINYHVIQSFQQEEYKMIFLALAKKCSKPSPLSNI